VLANYGLQITYLRGCIAGAAASCLQSLALFVHVAQTKVHDFKLSIEVDKQVFRLQVTVTDSKLVDVVHSSEKLL